MNILYKKYCKSFLIKKLFLKIIFVMGIIYQGIFLLRKAKFTKNDGPFRQLLLN